MPNFQSYYSSPGDGHFHKVIALHETKDAWEDLVKKAPLLPRGWFELARLNSVDRLEFSKAFWFSKIPFLSTDAQNLEMRLHAFFEGIEEIGIFLTQSSPNQLFDVHMVYGLFNGEGFFHGAPPASKEAIDLLTKQFGAFHFPQDYLAFLEIHDGFCKYTDTGLIKIRDMARTYQKFQELFGEYLAGPDGEGVNPTHLIPFYESEFLHFYQCFYADWYPGEEMGNLHFSEERQELSNYLIESRWEENGAYPSFLRWLLSYLEDYFIDVQG